MVAAVYKPEPSATPAPLGDQLSAVISQGFQAVLHDVRAVHQEMANTNQQILRSAQLVARRMEEAQRSYATGGLSAPSGMTPHAISVQAAYARSAAEAATTQRAAISGAASLFEIQDRNIGGGMEAYTQARSVQGIRGRVANNIERAASRYMEGGSRTLTVDQHGEYYEKPAGYHYDPSSGRWRDDNSMAFVSHNHPAIEAARILKTPGYHQDVHGRWHNTATGRMASADEVRQATGSGWRRVQQYQDRRQIVGGISDAAEAWRSGAPISRALFNALPKGLAAKAGVTAAVVAGTYGAIQKSQQVWRDAQEYRQIYGGSSWEGFTQGLDRRIGSFQQSLNPFGPGGREYGAFFDAAAQQGLRGNARNQYIGGGLGLLGAGANQQQAMSLLNTTFNTGQSLAGLTEAIKTLGKASRDAGVNANTAKNQFAQVYEQLATNTRFYGREIAKTTALSIARSDLTFGREFAGKTDYSGIGNELQGRQLAAREGISYPAWLAKGGSTLVAGETLAKERIRRMPNAKGQTIEDVTRQFIQANPGWDPQIQGELLAQTILGAGFEPGPLREMVKMSTGIDPGDDPQNIALQAAILFTDKSPAAREGQTTAAQNAQFGYKGGQGGVVRSSGAAKDDHIKRALHKDATSKVRGSRADEAARNELQNYPVAAQLLKNVSQGKYGSIGSLRWKVRKADGSTLVVNSEDLFKNFSDQVQTGQVILVQGDDQIVGKSVSDLIGFSQTNTSITGLDKDKPASLSYSDKTLKGKFDMTGEDWDTKKQEERDKKAEKEGAAAVGVTIDLTPEAKQLVRAMSSGGISLDPSTGMNPGD